MWRAKLIADSGVRSTCECQGAASFRPGTSRTINTTAVGIDLLSASGTWIGLLSSLHDDRASSGGGHGYRALKGIPAARHFSGVKAIFCFQLFLVVGLWAHEAQDRATNAIPPSARWSRSVRNWYSRGANAEIPPDVCNLAVCIPECV